MQAAGKLEKLYYKISSIYKTTPQSHSMGAKTPKISPHIIMTTHSHAHGTNSTLESNSWNVKERMLEM